MGRRRGSGCTVRGQLPVGGQLPDPWVWMGMLAWAVLASLLGFALLGRLRADLRDLL